MKASLIYWHKARLRNRYIVEMKLYNVEKSRGYKGGIKFSLICLDLKTKMRVLFDNHHPKGPHVHIGDKEISYHYINEEKLFSDFKKLVFEHMEVKL